ncbi:MAG: ABC transporter ATP-binding protein [Patescibacteria group bacterium]
MEQAIISAQNLSKAYRISHRASYGTLRDSISQLAKRLLTKTDQHDTVEEYWALRDINFDVQTGECIGIIGKNGAGKSTLLKILSQITSPTSGQVTINGRVASLLEVGTGFHSELTGRENIFLNGAILGMKQSEIRKKFDEIVAFAEVEKFLDTPVKRYSSGMYVRLAFAVAAHLEPEILIVDEVLAVGDAEFQKKSLGKMREVSERSGRTVIFVSHNMAAIRKLCQRVLLLDKGRIIASGKTDAIITQYLRPQQEYQSESLFNDDAHDVQFRRVATLNIHNQPVREFSFGDKILLQINFDVKKKIFSTLIIGFEIYNDEGLCIFTSTNADQSGVPKKIGVGKFQANIYIDTQQLLRPGNFTLNFHAIVPNICIIENIEGEIGFSVMDSNENITSKLGYIRRGVLEPVLPWNIQKLS